MDPEKVCATKDWKEPKNVHDVKVFLGMVNYQRKFVEGYSKVTTMLVDLLKKDR